ncbi:hypothetical protein KEM54_006727 [Ascosphaera aggregata]|nr:hypothetical protein KEM54_006727 [Ascosphaera aggregata]
MSLSTRLLAPIESVLTRASGALYVCSTCRRQCYQPISQCLDSHAVRVRIRFKSGGNGGFGDVMKKNLWGKNAEEIEKSQQEEGGEGLLERKIREKQEAAARGADGEGEVGAERTQQTGADSSASGSRRLVVEARHWNGLPVHRGADEKLWKRKPYEGDFYEPFIPSEKTTDSGVLLSMVHQTVVEMLVLKSLNKPIRTVCEYINHDVVLPLLNRVNINAGEEFETTTLEYDNEQEKQTILAVFENPNNQKSVKEVDEIILSVPKNLGFLQLPLADPEIKFMFLKRVMQLSGHFFPNSELPRLHSVGSVLKYLKKASKPKPKKIAETLLSAEDLTSLPNVKISPKKVSISARETEVGRWKIIEEELIRRGLPVNADAQR